MIFFIAFGLFCFVPVQIIQSYTIHIKLNELNEPVSRYESGNIKKILDKIIAEHKDSLNITIRNCISNEKTKKKKLRCIINVLEKKNTRSWHRANAIPEFESSEYFIAKSLENNLDGNKFADDYIDFLSLREDKTNARRANDFILKKILRSNTDSDSSDSDNYDNSYVNKFKPKKIIRRDPYSYMQGPSRIYDVNLDRRRRLPHFLPKRHYWDEDDLKELKNYWTHGPQGKYPGAYRITY